MKENKEIFPVTPIIQSGTFKETELVEVYELKVKTKEKKTTTVKVIKDKKTQKVIVTDVTPEIRYPPVRPPTVVTQEDNFGNFEVITTNKKVIKESKEIQTVVKNVYKEKPQLIDMPAVSVKTVTYGDMEESTVVFAKERKSTIQVTTTKDIKTEKVKVISSKVLPVIYKPWVPIEPVVEVEYIPTVLIE